MANPCLITGAVLHDLANGRSCRCDLFRVGDCFIAHLAGQARAPAWRYETPDAQEKVIEVTPGAQVVEVSDIFAWHTDWAQMNRVAQEYLGF